MNDEVKLKQHLLASQAVSEADMDKAERYAAEHEISLEQALLALKAAGFPVLGQALASICGVPYRPIRKLSSSDRMQRGISLKCLKAWHAVTQEYDSETHRLSIAVDDKESVRRLERILGFFMHPDSPAFTIASRPEIDEALETEAGGDKADTRELPAEESSSQAAAPAKLQLSGLHRARSQLTARPAARAETQHATAISEERFREYSDGLVAAVSLLVRTRLADDAAELMKVRTRVRYCRLLASRLGLPRIPSERLVLSAWLSALRDDKEVMSELAAVVKTEDVIFPENIPVENRSAEAAILGLVECYQSIRMKDSAASKDVNFVRRHLRAMWPAAETHDGALETFLQVLMDEQFLARLDKSYGKLLVVDADEEIAPTIAPPLGEHGYEVQVVGNAEAADRRIAADPPDLILASVRLRETDGLQLCRRIKGGAETGRMRFIALLEQGEQDRAADCLRVGADDYVFKPVKLDLLFLKIDRLLAPGPNGDEKEGVSGNLRDMSFSDMIQVLCVGNRSVEIALTRAGLDGKVHIENGQIIHASVGELEGESAFYALMRWQDGVFTSRRLSRSPLRTITRSATSLLMEGARLDDEEDSADAGMKSKAPRAQPLQ